jgi:hypothetical protein
MMTSHLDKKLLQKGEKNMTDGDKKGWRMMEIVC